MVKAKVDYSKTCWYCGGGGMKPVDPYYQCQECGATWNEQPSLGPYLDIATDNKGQRGTPSYHLVKKSGRVKGGPPLPVMPTPSRR